MQIAGSERSEAPHLDLNYHLYVLPCPNTSRQHSDKYLHLNFWLGVLGLRFNLRIYTYIMNTKFKKQERNHIIYGYIKRGNE